MQSLRLLVATVLLAIAAAQPDRVSAWDATARDRTEECKGYTEFAPAALKCGIFEKCCKLDPLNGDKCKNQVKTCEQNDDGEFEFACTYTNCTEMITTTTTTTTQSPRQINGAPGTSLCLLISAILPRFLF